MNEQPRQYSPDGRWWWDGQQWQPVQRPATKPRRTGWRSNTWIWWACGGLLAAGLLITILGISQSPYGA